MKLNEVKSNIDDFFKDKTINELKNILIKHKIKMENKMLLDGIANRDFKAWMSCSKTELSKSNLDETCHHAVIVEWLDSIGIYTDAQMVSGFDFENNKIHSPVWFMNVFSEECCYTDDVEEYPSRKQATIKAIIKANEIYNNRFKNK